MEFVFPTSFVDRVLSWLWVRFAAAVLLQGVSIRPDGSGATHQTSIEGSAEVISRSRRLSEKAGECFRLASLRRFSLHRSFFFKKGW